MWVLGLNVTGPNTSACLINENEIIAFVEEERFTRVKLATNTIPIRSVEYCLKQAGINFSEINEVVLGWDYSKYPEEMRNFYSKYNMYRKSEYDEAIENLNLYSKSSEVVTKQIQIAFAKKGWTISQDKISFTRHHEAHAASVHYLSKVSKNLVLVMDGSGEEIGTSIWLGEKNALTCLESYLLPDSLGYYYAALTEFLGFSVFTGEGKVMGMAPYGKPNLKYRAALKKFLTFSDGKYSVKPEYIYFGEKELSFRFTKNLNDLLDRKPRLPESPFTQDDYDLAFETQKMLEDVVIEIVKEKIKTYDIDSICISGGVAMNCKMNGKIAEINEVKNVFVTPASNDAGVALGAALITLRNLGYSPSEVGSTFTAYLGPNFSNEEIAKELQEAKIYNFEFFENFNELSKYVSKLLAEGKIIGWFQDRMEVGSRALGNRSILANPQFPNMKDKINKEVKRREKFRPFAPSILETEAEKWFEFKSQDLNHHKWMLQAVNCKKEKVAEIPAVVHVDYSVRAQVVYAEDNLKYHNLLEDFFELTGIPVLLNTSFNVRGEPIICKPAEALRCFYSHGLDVLVMENYVLRK
jgi:carbamoyltransferase